MQPLVLAQELGTEALSAEVSDEVTDDNEGGAAPDPASCGLRSDLRKTGGWKAPRLLTTCRLSSLTMAIP